MPLYPEYIIREVADKNDIKDVVSDYVTLKKAGSSYVGLCPFHNEKTPSFSVSPQKGIFHCFGCGEGGNVIHFLMKIERIPFTEALERLAQRANVALPTLSKRDSDEYKKLAQKRDRLYEVNEVAAQFFYENLKDGKSAVEYFKKRNLSGADAKHFFLGYAKDSWDALFTYLKNLGYTESEILDAGLIKRSENGKYYDAFRNRVMFPIFDLRNRAIGFGGRVLDDSKPKYLNSPDSPVFNKSRNLYFLNAARKSGENFVILVEGYMDVIALAKNGYLNTVATLGTALTKEQAKMIASDFKEVVICYDSDGAGRNATDRAIRILREHDIKISVMNLKDKKDPDEYLNAYGKTRFNNCIFKRKSDMAYLMECLEEKYDVMKNDEKVSFVGEMLGYLKLIKNPVELDVYIEEMSQSTGVSSNAIYSQLGVVKAVGQRRETDVPADVTAIAQRHTAHTDDASLGRTRELLLGLLMSDKSLLTKHNLLLAEPLFESDVHKKLLTYISACADIGKMPETGDVLNLFDGDDINEISLILSLDNKADDPNKAFCDYVKIINDRLNKRRIMSLLKGGGENLEKLNKIIKNQ